MNSKVLVLGFVIILFPVLCWAQGKRYHIKGHFTKGTTATKISFGENTIAIKDNKFELFGYTPKNEATVFKTDKNKIGEIWLMPGVYDIELEENDTLISFAKIISAPVMAKDYHALANYKKIISDDAVSKKWPNDSITCKFNNQLWAYAKQVKTNEVLTAFVNQLSKTNCDAALIKKLASLHGNKNLTLEQEQQARLQKGKQVADFTLKNQNDSSFILHSVKAKYILLDFWAAWCGPCRRKHPLFVNLYNKYKAKGFEIVSVSLDDNKQKWLTALKLDKMNWINVSELKGWKSTLVTRYGVNKLPFNMLLNSKFEIITTDASVGVIEAFLKQP